MITDSDWLWFFCFLSNFVRKVMKKINMFVMCTERLIGEHRDATVISDCDWL